MKNIRKHWHANTQSEVADIFGQSVKTIQNWSAAGMPGGKGKYPLGKIAVWLRKEGPWRPKAVATGDPLMEGADTPSLERYRAAKAEMIEMDLDERLGVTANIETIKAALVAFFPPFRKAIVWLGKEYGPRAQKRMDQALKQAEKGVTKAIESFGPPPT